MSSGEKNPVGKKPAPATRLLICLGAALFYSYPIWQILSHFGQALAYSQQAAVPLNLLGWSVLGSGLLLPAVAYVLSLLWSSGRSVSQQLLIMLMGLSIAAIFTANLLFTLRPIQLVL